MPAHWLVFSGILCQTPVWAEEGSLGCWGVSGWSWESGSVAFGMLVFVSCLDRLAPGTPHFLGFPPSSLGTPSQALFWDLSLLPNGYMLEHPGALRPLPR